MLHRATSSFWSAYNALPAEIRARAVKQFSLLESNPRHPSLQLKKVGMREGQEVWSARVSQKYRALAISVSGDLMWFWIGEHDVYDYLLGLQADGR